MKRLSPLNKWTIIFVLLGLLHLVVIIPLFATKIVEINWIFGWILGFLVFIFAVYFGDYSVKLLIKTENYYFFYFLFLVRFGIYATPFFIGIFFPNVFSVIGILIGFSGIIFIPYVRYIFKNINSKRDYKKEELENVS